MQPMFVSCTVSEFLVPTPDRSFTTSVVAASHHDVVGPKTDETQ